MAETELTEKGIQNLLTKCIKEKNRDAVSVLKMIKTKIQTEKGRQKNVEELSGDEVLKLVKREIKEIQETIEALKKTGAKERLQEEDNKIKVLEALLPPSLTDEELGKIIHDANQEVGKDNFGKVMKAVMAMVEGRADGKRVSSKVRELLA